MGITEQTKEYLESVMADWKSHYAGKLADEVLDNYISSILVFFKGFVFQRTAEETDAEKIVLLSKVFNDFPSQEEIVKKSIKQDFISSVNTNISKMIF